MAYAQANPTNPVVTNGQATFQSQGKALTVTNTPGAIINWQSFSIGAGETTRFQQQSAASTVLNRVRGQDPSVILGTLSSNGQVFLINQNGILFGAGSRVDTQGLIASTLNISDADFKKGVLKFAKEGQAGAIQVQGFVNGGSGDIYIIAPNVSVAKEGVIRSEGGNVVLAAGEKVDLGSRNLNDMKFEVQAPANQALVLGKLSGGAVGVFAGTLKHSGDIRAQTAAGEGGKIVLAARDALTIGTGSQTVADGRTGGNVEIRSESGALTIERGAQISASGTSAVAAITNPVGGSGGSGGTVVVRADQGSVIVETSARLSVDGSSGGSVTLQARSGVTTFAGEVSARGSTASASSAGADALPAVGGRVEVLGREVALTEAALLDVSGDAGGGTLLVGGDFQGRNAQVQNALFTRIAPDVVLRADAMLRGDGGRAIVWADVSTVVTGSISAMGGTQGGNGGLVETSGKGMLMVTRAPTVHARRGGRGGEWLLDPNNIRIGVTSQNVTAGPNFTSTDNDSIVDVSLIVAALEAGTSVTVTTGTAGANSQDGFIRVQASISKTAGGDASLTLNAHQNIIVESGISIASSAGRLHVTLNADSAAANNGGIILDNGSQILSNGGNVTLTGGGGAASAAGGISGPYTANDGAEIRGLINAGGGNITINARTSVDGANGVRITGPGGLQTSGSGLITLVGTANGTSGSGISMIGSNNIAHAGTGTVSLTGVAPSGLGLDINTLAATAVSSNGGTIALTADSVSFGAGQIAAPGGSITIAPFSPGTRAILLGEAVGTGLIISNSDLQRLETAVLTIGSASQLANIVVKGAQFSAAGPYTGVTGLTALNLRQAPAGPGALSIDYFSSTNGDGQIGGSSYELRGIELGTTGRALSIIAGAGGIIVPRGPTSLNSHVGTQNGAVTLDTTGAIGSGTWQLFPSQNAIDTANYLAFSGVEAPSSIAIGQTHAPTDVWISGGANLNFGLVTINGDSGANQTSTRGLIASSVGAINFNDNVNVGVGRLWALADSNRTGTATNAVNLAAGKFLTTTSTAHVTDAAGVPNGVLPVELVGASLNIAGDVNVGDNADVYVAPRGINGAYLAEIYVGNQTSGLLPNGNALPTFRLSQATIDRIHLNRVGANSTGGLLRVGSPTPSVTFSSGPITFGTGANSVTLLPTSSGAFGTTGTIDRDSNTGTANALTLSANAVTFNALGAIGQASGSAGMVFSAPSFRVIGSGGNNVTLTETSAGNTNVRRLTTNGAGNVSVTKASGTLTFTPFFAASLDRTLTSGNIAISANNVVVNDTTINAGGTLSINATGTLTVAAGVVAIPGQTFIESTGLQTINANGITVQGAASGSGNFAEIRSAGGQIITVGAGGIAVSGGTGTNNWAGIKQTGAATHQTITVNGGGDVFIAGGTGTDNFARIENSGPIQSLDFSAAGSVLTILGGTGGNGNEASFDNNLASATSQTISFASGGNINLTGGTVGNGNAAVIVVNGGNQTINGNAAIAAVGGASGGAVNDDNAAAIVVDDLVGSGTQTINASSISLTGGAGGTIGAAAIVVGNALQTQVVNATGNVTLQGGAGNDSAAIIGSLDNPANTTLTVGGTLQLTGGSGAGTIGSVAIVGAINAGATVTANVQGGVTLNAGAVGGAIVGSSTSGAGSVTVNAGLGGTGNLALNAGQIRTGGSASLTTSAAGGSISQAIGGVINAGALTTTSGAGTVLTAGINSFASYIGTNSTTGDLAVNNNSGGSYNFSATNSAPGGNVGSAGATGGIIVPIGGRVQSNGGLVSLGASSVQILATGANAVNSTGNGATSTGGDIVFSVDNAALGSAAGSVNAGTAGAVRFFNVSPGRPIDLGTEVAGALSLTASEIGSITGAMLRIGTSTAGDISISNPITVSPGVLSLETGGGVATIGGGNITAGALGVRAVNAVSLAGGTQVGSFAATVSGAGQALSLTNNSGVLIGSVDVLDGVRTNNANLTVQTTGANSNVTVANTAASEDVDAGSGTLNLGNLGIGGTASTTVNGQVRGGRVVYTTDHLIIGAGSTTNATTFGSTGGIQILAPTNSTVPIVLTDSGSGAGVVTQSMLDTFTLNSGNLTIAAWAAPLTVAGNIVLTGALQPIFTNLTTRGGNIAFNANISTTEALFVRTTEGGTNTGTITGAGRIASSNTFAHAAQGINLTNATNSLGVANLSVSTSGNITAANGVSIVGLTFFNNVPGGSVTVNSSGFLSVFGSSSTNNGAVNLNAAILQLDAPLSAGSGAVSLTATAPLNGTINQSASGTITASSLALDTSASTNNGSVALRADSGGILSIAGTSKIAGNLTLNAGGRIVDYGGTVDVGGTTSITAGGQTNTGNLRVTGQGIAASIVNGAGTSTITAGGAGGAGSDFDLSSLYGSATQANVVVNLTGAAYTAGNVRSASAIALAAAPNVITGPVTIRTADPVISTGPAAYNLVQGGALNFGGKNLTVTGSGVNDVTLTNASNNSLSQATFTNTRNTALTVADATVLGASTVTGTLGVTGATGLTLSGTLITGGDTTLLSGAGTLSIGGNINAGAGVIDFGAANVSFSGLGSTLTSSNVGTGLLSSGTWTLSGVGGPQVTVDARAALNTVTLSPGTNYTLQFLRPSSVNTLNWNAGTVAGAGGANGESLTVNTALNWAGGAAFNLPVLNIGNGAIANISGTVLGDNGITVNNAGTWNHNGASFNLGDGTTIFNNQATGILNLVGAGTISSVDQFTNAGQIVKSGAGTATLSAGDGANTWTGSGSVDGQAGTLALSSFSGTNQMAYTGLAGGIVHFSGSVRTFGASSSFGGGALFSFTGAGNNTVSGAVTGGDFNVAAGTTALFNGASGATAGTVTSAGTTMFNAGAASTLGSLTISGGTFTPTSIVNTGGLTWSGGTIAAGAGGVTLTGTGTWTDTAQTTLSGGLRVGTGATLNVIGPTDAQKRIGAGTLTIDSGGTFLWSAGMIDVVGNGTVVNNGLFETTTNLNLGDRSGGVGTVSFTNGATGIIRKSGGPGAPNSNSATTLGSLGAVAGTANFINFTNNGAIDVQVGTLQFNFGQNGATGGGTVTNNGATTVASGANIEWGGPATHSAASSFTGAGGFHVFRGGNVNVNGAFSLSGDVTVGNGGSGSATATFAPATAMNIANLSVSGASATFGGTLSANSLALPSGTATFNGPTNLVNATQSGGTLTGTGLVNVSGAMTWSGGSMAGGGTTALQSGATLAITGGVTNSRTLTNAGTTTWSSGAVTNIGTITNSGVFNAQTSNNAHDLLGTGIFNNQSGAVFNSNPGGGTDATFEGTFNNAAGATINIAAGSNFNYLTGATFNNSGSMVFALGAQFRNGTNGHFGTINMNAGSSLTGDGIWTVGLLGLNDTATIAGNTTLGPGMSFVQAGGTTTLAAGQTLTVPTLSQSGGSMGGSGNLTVTNSYSRTGGTLAGTLANISITQSTGNLAAPSFAATSSVTLAAPAGAITDANGAGTVNVTAPTVTLSAINGIDLDTATGSLTMSNTSGGAASVRNTGALALGNITSAGALSIINNAAITQAGGTSITAAAGATFDTSAAATLGSVDVTAQNPGGGGLTIAGGSRIAGNFTLAAGTRNVDYGSTVDIGGTVSVTTSGTHNTANQRVNGQASGAGVVNGAGTSTITAGGGGTNFGLTQSVYDQATQANIDILLTGTNTTAGGPTPTAAAITLANAGNSIAGPLTLRTIDPLLSTGSAIDYNLTQAAAINFGNRNVRIVAGSTLGDVTLANLGNIVGGSGVFRFSGTRVTQFITNGSVLLGASNVLDNLFVQALGAGVTMQGAISGAGSTTLRGQADVVVNAAYTNTAGVAGRSFAAISDASVVFSNGGTGSISTTQPLNVILNSDRAGAGDGAIALFGGTSITTAGGTFTAGGGADPLTTSAVGTAFFNDGVGLFGTTISTGGGAISIRGTGFAGVSNNHGVSIGGGTLVGSASGAIGIVGVGGAGSGTDNHGVTIAGGGAVRSLAGGNVSVTGTAGSGGLAVHVAGGAAISSTGTNGANATAVLAATAGQAGGAVNVTGIGGNIAIDGNVVSTGGTGGRGFDAVVAGDAGTAAAAGGAGGAVTINSTSGAVAVGFSGVVQSLGALGGIGGNGAAGSAGANAVSAIVFATNGQTGGAGGTGGVGGAGGTVQVLANTTIDASGAIESRAANGGEGGNGALGGVGGNGLAFSNGGNGGSGGSGGVGGNGGNVALVTLRTTPSTGGSISVAGSVYAGAGNAGGGGNGGNGGAGGGASGFFGPGATNPRRGGNGGTGGSAPSGGNGGNLALPDAILISSGGGNIDIIGGSGVSVAAGVAGGPQSAGAGGAAGIGVAGALNGTAGVSGSQFFTSSGGNADGLVRLEALNGRIDDAGGSGVINAFRLLATARDGVSLQNSSNDIYNADARVTGTGDIVLRTFQNVTMTDLDGDTFAIRANSGNATIGGNFIDLASNVQLGGTGILNFQPGVGVYLSVLGGTVDANQFNVSQNLVFYNPTTVNAPISVVGALELFADLTVGGATPNVTANTISWNGGALTAGTIDIANGGTIANFVVLDAALNLNGGTTTLANSDVSGSGTVTVASGANLRATGLSSLTNGGGLVNNGVLSVDAENGDTTLVIGGSLVNSTTINLTSSGSGGNATLDLGGSTLTNTGQINAVSGAGGARTIRAGSFDQQSGQIGGDTALVVDAPFFWTGGNIAAGVDVRLQQGGSISGGTRTLGGTLSNQNGATLALDDVTINGSGAIVNDAQLQTFGANPVALNVPVSGAGNLLIGAPTAFAGFVQQGDAIDINAGGSADMPAGFNINRVTLAGGDLFNQGTSTANQLDIGPGSTLSGGTVQTQTLSFSGGTIAGSTTVEAAAGGAVSGAPILDGTLLVNGGTLTFSGANLGGSGILGNHSALQVSSGANTVATDVAGFGALDVNLGASVNFSGAITGSQTITLNGNATFGQGLAASSLGIIGGSAQIGAGSSVSDLSISAGGTLSGAGAMSVGNSFAWSTGTVSNAALTLANGGSISGAVTLNAPLDFTGGTLLLDGANVAGTGSIGIASGRTFEAVADSSINLSGGISVPAGGNLVVNADFHDSAPVTLDITGNLTNSGTLRLRGGNTPGHNATLNVTGVFDNSGVLQSDGPGTPANTLVAGSFNQLAGSTISGSAPLDLNVAFNWLGGAINAGSQLNLLQGGTVGGGSRILNGTLNNVAGTLTISGATLSGSGAVTNDAQLDLLNATIAQAISGTGAMNLGGTTQMGGSVAQGGTLVIQSGSSINFAQGVSTTTLDQTAGGALSFAAASSIVTYNIGGAGQASGAGPISITAGLSAGNASFSSTVVNIGAGANAVLGAGGTTTGFSGGSINNAAGASLTIPGTLALSGGAVLNNAGALGLSGTGASPITGGAGGQVNNSGTLTNSGGVAHTIATRFVNTGTVNVNAGTLDLHSGVGSDSGTYNVAGGAVLGLRGDRTLGVASSVSAAGGTVVIDPVASGGSAVTSNGAFNAGNLQLVSGTFNVGSIVTVGDYSQSGGTLNGTGGDFLTGSGFAGGGSGVTGTFGNVNLTQVSGNLVVDSLSATQSITLSAPAGAITDANGSGSVNLSAPAINLSAVGGIDIDTQTGLLSATNTGGALAVRNTGALAVSAINQSGGGPINLDNSGNLTLLTNLAAGSSPVTIVVNGGRILQGVGGAAITSSSGIDLTATGIGAPGARLGIVGPYNVTATGSGAAGDIHLQVAGNVTLPTANISPGSGSSLDLLVGGTIDVSGNFSTGGGAVALASVGALTIGNGAAPALITGSNVSLSGASVLVQGGSVAGVTGVDASGSLNISTGGGNLVVQGGSDPAATARLVSAGSATVNLGSGSLIIGGVTAQAPSIVDPVLPGATLTVTAGNVTLQGGATANAFAVLQAAGDINLGSATVSLNAMASPANVAIVSDQGRLILNFPSCSIGGAGSCVPLLGVNPYNPGVPSLAATGLYSGFEPIVLDNLAAAEQIIQTVLSLILPQQEENTRPATRDRDRSDIVIEGGDVCQ
ncbi:MAG: filamentous hemagglutinin N-terminal domain-containing protein [Burkholderiales bacterium]